MKTLKAIKAIFLGIATISLMVLVLGICISADRVTTTSGIILLVSLVLAVVVGMGIVELQSKKPGE